MKKIFTKICCLWLIFISISLSAGPLGGSRESEPGKNPFKLLQDFIKENTEEEVETQDINAEYDLKVKEISRTRKVVDVNNDFDNVFFKIVSDDFYNLEAINENIYADIPFDIRNRLVNKNIEIFFLDLILKESESLFTAYDEYYPKIFEVLNSLRDQQTIEIEKLSKLERKLFKNKDLTPSQIADIKNKIQEQKNSLIVSSANLRKWLDFTKFLINKNAVRWDGGIKVNGWISAVNPNYKESLAEGPGITIWSVLNNLSNATIYYKNFKFLKADLAAHDAILNFLSLDFSSNNIDHEDLFMKDLAFYALLSYFYEIPADKRLCKLLINSYLSARYKTHKPINKKIAYKLSYLINSISNEYYEREKQPSNESLVQVSTNDINQKFVSYSKVKIVEEILQNTLRFSMEGNKNKALYYWNSNKIDDQLGSIYVDIINGYIKGATNIPSAQSKVFFDLLSSFDKNSYEYFYIKLYENLITANGLRNANKLEQSDSFLKQSIIYLDKIANVYIHPPGTTIPSALVSNRLLLELMIEFTLSSGLDEAQKKTVIYAGSTLSLSAEELQYVHGQELIENTNLPYEKDISIKLNNQIIKREMIYEKLLYQSLSGDEKIRVNSNDIHALERINSILHNAQLYLYNQSRGNTNRRWLGKNTNKQILVNTNNEEIIVNLFCLEINCFAYKKIHSDFEITSINKKKLFLKKEKFYDLIVNKEKFTPEAESLGQFIFGKFSNLSNITKCNIVATSGLSNIPFSLVMINNKY